MLARGIAAARALARLATPASPSVDVNCVARARSQMFGLCLACFGVLLLPMDVANRNSAFSAAISSASGIWGGEALPMTELWEFVLLAIVIMVLGVIPFAIFYYEESGEGCVR